MSQSERDKLKPLQWLSVLARTVGELRPKTVQLLVRFFKNPVGFILTTIVFYFYANFIRPPIRAVVVITARLEAAIDTAFQAFAGSFTSVGDAVSGGGEDVGSALLRVYADYTRAVEALAADAGVLGLPIVTFLNVVGLGVGLWLTWFVVRAIIENLDVPFISLEGLVNLVARPVRAVVGFVAGVVR